MTTVRTAIAAVAAGAHRVLHGGVHRCTARCWADAGGAEPLGRLLDDAVTLIEPL